MRWLLAAPAPPGTVPPPPPDGDGSPTPTARRCINAAAAAGGGQDGQHQRPRGKVCFKLPAVKRCIELTDPMQIPVGATIDTTKGRVNLISAADKGGTTQSAWFYDGMFKIGQTRGAEADHRPRAGRAAS